MNELNGIVFKVHKKDAIEGELPEIMTAADVQGIVINEILPDPNGASFNTDTDGDGNFETDDEYIELFNTTGSDVDISNWTITDSGGNVFTFPASSIIPADGYVVVMGGWDGSALPSNYYEGVPALNNGGDELTLSDGTNDALASYGSGSGGDDFGSDMDGTSIQRDPDGGMSFVNDLDATPLAQNTCFLPGTKILTSKGYKNIEELSVGEMIQTAEGELIPIKWVGCQSVDISEHLDPLRSFPIKISVNALGENIPSADLFVSPNHAIYVEGFLINAGALVNDVNVKMIKPEKSFKYYHIELDVHALLIAEGASAESFLPQHENRAEFDNGAEYEELYGTNIILWPLDYPRINSKNKVPDQIFDKILGINKLKKIA